MIIKIWSDFQCPYCYIEEKKLEEVIHSIELTQPVRLEYKAYQLNPTAPVVPVQTMLSRFMDGHEMTREHAERRMAKITRMATEVGLTYDMANVKVCNTMDAHRLMKFASGHLTPGQLSKLNFRLFKATFEEGLLLSDRELLVKIGEESGLDATAIRLVLASEEYKEEVKQDAEEVDVRTDFEFVPFFLFPGDVALQGVVSNEKFREVLTAAMQGADISGIDSDTPHEGCGPNGCSI